MDVFSALFTGLMVWSSPISPVDLPVPDYTVTPLGAADLDLYLTTMHTAAAAMVKAGSNVDMTIAEGNGVEKRYQAVRQEIETLVGPATPASTTDTAVQAADQQLLAPHKDEIVALEKQVRGTAN